MKLLFLLLICITLQGLEMENELKGMNEVYKFVEKNLGVNRVEWDMYRNSVASIESQGGRFHSQYRVYNYAYAKQGGKNKAYDGRYQMGADAKESGANNFKIQNPGHTSQAREAFLNDPLLQEKLFAGFTVSNYRFMTGNSEYLRQKGKEKFMNANLVDKMGYLAFGHNSGGTNLSKYLAGEIPTFRDGNQHDARNYIDAFHNNLKVHGSSEFQHSPGGVIKMDLLQMENK